MCFHLTLHETCDIIKSIETQLHAFREEQSIMTLEELGKQYLQKSIQLNERISTLREELKKLSPERRHKMNRRLNSLSASALQ